MRSRAAALAGDVLPLLLAAGLVLFTAPAPKNRAALRPAISPGDSAIVSVKPRTKVPLPDLPRLHAAATDAELARVCDIVESEIVRAGVTPEYASGVTGPLRGALSGRGPLETYPVGMYYFLVREAALGHDKATAARNLLASYLDRGILRLSTLPARERKL